MELNPAFNNILENSSPLINWISFSLARFSDFSLKVLAVVITQATLL